jgi:hypothetical protein
VQAADFDAGQRRLTRSRQTSGFVEAIDGLFQAAKRRRAV